MPARMRRPGVTEVLAAEFEMSKQKPLLMKTRFARMNGARRALSATSLITPEGQDFRKVALQRNSSECLVAGIESPARSGPAKRLGRLTVHGRRRNPSNRLATG